MTFMEIPLLKFYRTVVTLNIKIKIVMLNFGKSFLE